MSQEQATKNFFNCLDANSEDCDELSFTAGPSTEFATILARNNAATRDEGTSRSQTNDALGFRYANTIAATDNVVIDPISGTATPGQNISFEANGLVLATQQPNEQGESINTVDTGGTEREGSNNPGQTQSLIDDQRVKQRTKIDGGNKAYPFITPLASTNIEGIEPIDPHSDVDNGESGTLYDPTLLEDEGIVYLRQYLSFDDEETGAVWRFQYAPQISWTRSATFQEDKSWGSNVQPAHYNNTSGKRVNVQGAILEGMTIGKTVTGAVTALEVLMSVANPDNELQVAPYAYRFIIGGRTLTEPISGRHAPFVIEQLTVKEEMYDTQGEMISVKVDLTLREIPYYQINDGRKLLLITQDRADLIRLQCEEITQKILEQNDLIQARKVQNGDALKEVVQEQNEGENSLGLAATNLTKDGSAQRRTLESNCNADSKAYTELVRLFRAYETGDNGRACNTGKDTSGFKTIEEQFARNQGVYEIMKGRKLTTQVNWLGIKVFDENGNYVKPYPEAIKELGISQSAPSPEPPLNNVNVSDVKIRANAGRSVDGVGRQNAYKPKDTDYLKSCPHIYCVSKRVGNNTSDENIEKALRILEYFAENGQKAYDELQAFAGLPATDANINALTELMTQIQGSPPNRPRTIFKNIQESATDTLISFTVFGLIRDISSAFENGTPSIEEITTLTAITPIGWLCGDADEVRPINTRWNDGNFTGLADNGGLLFRNARFTYDFFQPRADDIKNESKWFQRWAGFFGDVNANANPVDNLVGAQICNCASYVGTALRNKLNDFEKDREQNCSVAAAAAQEAGPYQGYVDRLNRAMETYITKHVGGVTGNSIDEFYRQVASDNVISNGGDTCVGSNGVGLSECLGAACIAENMAMINDLLQPVGGLSNNPLDSREEIHKGVI